MFRAYDNEIRGCMKIERMHIYNARCLKIMSNGFSDDASREALILANKNETAKQLSAKKASRTWEDARHFSVDFPIANVTMHTMKNAKNEIEYVSIRVIPISGETLSGWSRL
jgi:hypothetical protein